MHNGHSVQVCVRFFFARSDGLRFPNPRIISGQASDFRKLFFSPKLILEIIFNII